MSKNFILDPTKTAIGNKEESYSAQLIAEYEEPPKVVLDYGCGRLRNSVYLRERGFDVSITDIPDMLDKIDTLDFPVVQNIEENTFDVVLCSLVLNVVLKDTRLEILNEIRKALKPKGYAYVEVRQKVTPIPKHRFKYQDGYAVGPHKVKTFQKTFTATELSSLVKKAGFKVLAVFDNERGVTAKIYK